MKEDPFGDLRDWGRVLDLLDRLVEEGKLDLVQPGVPADLWRRFVDARDIYTETARMSLTGDF